MQIRTPTTGQLFEGAALRDVPIWDGVEWQASGITPVSAVRPAGVPDGTSILDTTLGANGQPIWRLAAAVPTGWIDATGVAV